jgi:hypothetical protein
VAEELFTVPSPRLCGERVRVRVFGLDSNHQQCGCHPWGAQYKSHSGQLHAASHKKSLRDPYKPEILDWLCGRVVEQPHVDRLPRAT